MSATEKIRAAINKLKMSKDDRMLVDEGILQVGVNSGQLVLTEAGQRVIIDTIWNSDAELRKNVAAAVKEVRKERKED